MRVFFKKMGIENVRFKPAYNPYTEVRRLKLISTRMTDIDSCDCVQPSLEIFAFHPQLK